MLNSAIPDGQGGARHFFIAATRKPKQQQGLRQLR